MASYPHLAIVAGYFPDFESWLERSGNPAGYMNEAETLLSRCGQNAVEQACRKLLQEDPPRSHSLPFRVASIAKQIAAAAQARRWESIADGETVACRLCEDTGWVSVLHPDTVADVLSSGRLPNFPYTAVVACICERGRYVAQQCREAPDPRNRRRVADFDERRHVRRVVGVPPMDQYRALLGLAPEYTGAEESRFRHVLRHSQQVAGVVDELSQKTWIV